MSAKRPVRETSRLGNARRGNNPLGKRLVGKTSVWEASCREASRNLGIFIDADLTVRSHVQRTVASFLAVLHQIRSIR